MSASDTLTKEQLIDVLVVQTQAIAEAATRIEQHYAARRKALRELHEVHGMSYRELAKVPGLGISRSAIEQALRQGD